MISKETLLSEFQSYFTALVNTIKDDLVSFDVPQDVISCISMTLDYNVQGGKMNRGLAAFITAKMLSDDPKIHKLSIILGWCIEILQACFLIADDVMDQSSSRRGQICWYRKVGLAAINDALLLESIVFRLLKIHFSYDPQTHMKLLVLFHDITFRTELGQLLDLTSLNVSNPNKLENFTMKRYLQMVRNKTAYYSFVLPVHASMILVGYSDISEFDGVKECLLELGTFFQIQDDFLDFFGDPSITGKVGTDIEEGKCTWIALKCMEKSTPDQLGFFREWVGKAEHRDDIARLYQSLAIDSDFHQLEEYFINQFSESCKAIEDKKLCAILEFFGSLVVKRQK